MIRFPRSRVLLALLLLSASAVSPGCKLFKKCFGCPSFSHQPVKQTHELEARAAVPLCDGSRN